MTNKIWARIAVFAAILGAAGLGLRFGQMQGKATGGADLDDGAFEVLTGGGTNCQPQGAVCFSPGDGSTLAAPSEAIAGTNGAPAPRLLRAGVDEAHAKTNDAPWMVRIDAALTHAAVAGNAIITVSDAADVQTGYTTAMRQGKIPSGSTLALRMRLSPVDGVAPGRLYRVRITQMVAHKEVVLAQGDVRLD